VSWKPGNVAVKIWSASEVEGDTGRLVGKYFCQHGSRGRGVWEREGGGGGGRGGGGVWADREGSGEEERNIEMQTLMETGGQADNMGQIDRLLHCFEFCRNDVPRDN